MDFKVYTDGSWVKVDKEAAYGGVVILNEADEPVFAQRYRTTKPTFVSGRNHGGELIAAMWGVATCFNLLQGQKGFIHVYYDYKGVQAFVEEWAPKSTWKSSSLMYHDFILNLRKEYPDNPIVFHKVAAHTGVKWNEVADSIASGHIPAYLQSVALPMREV